MWVVDTVSNFLGVEQTVEARMELLMAQHLHAFITAYAKEGTVPPPLSELLSAEGVWSPEAIAMRRGDYSDVDAEVLRALGVTRNGG